jgi:phosphomannomutase
MIPWLLVIELIALRRQSLGSMLAEQMAAFPASGEINRRLDDAKAAMARVEAAYAAQAALVDRTDGLSMSFANWRFNLRCSNTEPLLRLNVESRADVALMQEKTRELLALIETVGEPA